MQVEVRLMRSSDSDCDPDDRAVVTAISGLAIALERAPLVAIRSRPFR